MSVVINSLDCFECQSSYPGLGLCGKRPCSLSLDDYGSLLTLLFIMGHNRVASEDTHFFSKALNCS